MTSVNIENHEEKKSITPSGFFGSDKNMIVELENFMTKEEVDFLENAAKSINIWDQTESHVNENGTVIYDSNYWANRVASGPRLNQTDPKIVPIITSLVERLKPVIEDFFNVKANPTGQSIVKWPTGYRQEPHADKELHIGPDAGLSNDFPWYDLASLFYLNDDYEGGELYFPLHDIKFKPKRGAAYFFPGDMNYIHGVTEVLSGVRFTCPFFWQIIEHTGDNKPDLNKQYYRTILDKEIIDESK